IEKLNITDEEMKTLETIIGKKEVKRRDNQKNKIRQKAKRRNEKGLTKRQQEKLNKENKIKELLSKGFGVREISRKLDINVSAVSRVKNNKY
ncbi:DNA-binding response regulator, partial [Clostridium botulinum]|nr:DNA-binding response regulator [Clostridium botulinum]